MLKSINKSSPSPTLCNKHYPKLAKVPRLTPTVRSKALFTLMFSQCFTRTWWLSKLKKLTLKNLAMHIKP